MNKIVLVGKLIKDPELRVFDNSEKMCARFIMAVERSFKSAEGIRESDLIPVTVWGKKAEAICKYLQKWSQISVSGRLRTGSYEDRDGNKRYIAEVVADDFKFLDHKKTETTSTDDVVNN